MLGAALCGEAGIARSSARESSSNLLHFLEPFSLIHVYLSDPV